MVEVIISHGDLHHSSKGDIVSPAVFFVVTDPQVRYHWYYGCR